METGRDFAFRYEFKINRNRKKIKTGGDGFCHPLISQEAVVDVRGLILVLTGIGFMMIADLGLVVFGGPIVNRRK